MLSESCNQAAERCVDRPRDAPPRVPVASTGVDGDARCATEELFERPRAARPPETDGHRVGVCVAKCLHAQQGVVVVDGRNVGPVAKLADRVSEDGPPQPV